MPACVLMVGSLLPTALCVPYVHRTPVRAAGQPKMWGRVSRARRAAAADGRPCSGAPCHVGGRAAAEKGPSPEVPHYGSGRGAIGGGSRWWCRWSVQQRSARHFWHATLSFVQARPSVHEAGSAGRRRTGGAVVRSARSPTGSVLAPDDVVFGLFPCRLLRLRTPVLDGSGTARADPPLFTCPTSDRSDRGQRVHGSPSPDITVSWLPPVRS